MLLENLKTVINDIIDEYNLDILLLVCIILFGIYVFLIAPILFVSTTEAVIDGHLINLSSRVSGQVTQVYITKDQEVKKGDLLMEVDPSDYRNELIKIETNLEINREKLKILTNNAHDINNLTSDINDEKSTNVSTPPKYKQGSNNITNYSKTYEPENLAEKNITGKRMALGDAIKNMSDMNSDTSGLNKENTDNMELSLSKLSVNKSKIDVSNDTVESVQKLIKENEQQKEEVKLLLSSTKIFAPRDGIVSGISVRVGDVVNPSDVLCTIIPKQVWVIARVNPTKLPQIQVGQNVKIKVKGYKNRTFKGIVTSVDKTMKVYQVKPSDEIIQFDTNGQIVNEPTPAYQIKIEFIEDYSDFNLPPDTEVMAKIKVRTFF